MHHKFFLLKELFNHCVHYSCTPNTLYLLDSRKVYTDLEDLKEYQGAFISCITLIDDISGNYSKKGKKLIHRYNFSPKLAHECIALHMGKKGVIDYAYKDAYPEAAEIISQIGNLIQDYYIYVKKISRLYSLLKDLRKIPDYTIEVVTFLCELSHNIDLDKLFEVVDIPFHILMRVTPEEIRRKISVEYPPKLITRRYVRASTSVHTNYLLGRIKKKDFLIYKNYFSFVKGRNQLNNSKAVNKKWIQQLLEIIQQSQKNITLVNVLKVNTRVCFDYSVPIWHRRVFAYIATHDKPFKKMVTLVKEINYQLPYDHPEKELLIVHFQLLNTKCTFKNQSVVISDSKDELSTLCSIGLAVLLLKNYKSRYEEVYDYLSRTYTEDDEETTHGKKISKKKVDKKGEKIEKRKEEKKSKVDDLRKQLPSLFVRNYTRECHRLPVLLKNKEEAKKYEKKGRLVIKYPLEGMYSRYYSSPSNDLYVGLKTNRLSNRSTFKYIVVCYTTNHLLNPSKRTYQYYYNNDVQPEENYRKDLKTLKSLTLGRYGPIPRTMEAEYGVYDYKRLGTGKTFISCLEMALNIDIQINNLLEEYSDCIYATKQEFWNVPISLIREQFLKGDIDATYYRFFEEVFKCNILVIEVDHRGKYKLTIPPHQGCYIWEPCRYKNYIVILKNIRKLYHDVSISYELIVKRKNLFIFNLEDILISKLIVNKRMCTFPPSDDWANLPSSRKIAFQYVDENGKCVLLFLLNGSIMECGSRPYPIPILNRDKMLKKCSYLYRHLINTNKLRTKKLRWISSTSTYLYFPTQQSFLDWIDED